VRATCPAHLIILYLFAVRWKAQIMKLLVMQFSPASCYFVPLRWTLFSKQLQSIFHINCQVFSSRVPLNFLRQLLPVQLFLSARQYVMNSYWTFITVTGPYSYQFRESTASRPSSKTHFITPTLIHFTLQPSGLFS
jgi:hypothetical protein